MVVQLRAQSWETSKGKLVLDGQTVSFTVGSKTETMGVADIEPFEAAHLTLMQWLGWARVPVVDRRGAPGGPFHAPRPGPVGAVLAPGPDPVDGSPQDQSGTVAHGGHRSEGEGPGDCRRNPRREVPIPGRVCARRGLGPGPKAEPLAEFSLVSGLVAAPQLVVGHSHLRCELELVAEVRVRDR